MKLDIKKIDGLNLENNDDLNWLGKHVEGIYNTTMPYIERLACTWDENIRFFEGDQYIYYNETERSWQVIPITKFNDWIPRPTTNYILPIVMTLTSLLTRTKPTARVFSNSDDDSDEGAARFAEKLTAAKWEIDNEQEKLIDAAMIALLCGTVFREDSWNYCKGKKIDTSDLKAGEKEEPVETTGEEVEEGVEKPDEMDLGSEDVGESDDADEVYVGDNEVNIYSPFEVIPDIENDSFIFKAVVKSLSDISLIYDKKGRGYTGKANEVKAQNNLSTVLTYRERLRVSTGGLYPTSTTEMKFSDSAVLVEFYLKPTKKHRKGLYVVEAGGIPLFVSESPCFDEDSGDWHPFTETTWIRSPLRRHGISCVENIVPKQRRINGIDSLIILNRETMVSPQWFIPNGMGIPEGSVSGRPGLVIRGNVRAAGIMPQKLNGVPLPPSVAQEREQQVMDMHIIAMDNEVMSGNQPSGVSTAQALNLLMEQTYNKFNPITQRWEKFIEDGQQKKLRLLQKKYIEPRKEVLGLMKELNGGVLDLDVVDFSQTNLTDNLRIRIEAGSSLPRSKAAENEDLKDLAGKGLFGPIDPVQNPVGNREFLEKLGFGAFEVAKNPDIEKAKYNVRVLTKINKGQLPLEAFPKMTPFDDIDIHMKVLVNEMKRPEFKDTQEVFKAKFDELNQAKEAILQQQMQEQMQMMLQQQGLAGGRISPQENLPPEMVQGVEQGPPRPAAGAPSVSPVMA